MNTESTELLYKALRTRLLGFTPTDPGATPGGATPDTLGDALGTRLFVVQAPDTVTYPYGIVRLQARQESGEYAGERETMELELLLYHRPRAKQYVLEGYADVADQAFLRYVDANGGLIFSGSRQRDTVPMNSLAADREVCAIRCVYDLIVWPEFLTQYSLEEA